MQRWYKIFPAASTVLALSALALLPPRSALAEPQNIVDPIASPVSFADIIEKVTPAVVSISVVTEEKPEAVVPQNFDFRGMPEGFRDFFQEFQRRGQPDNMPRRGYSQGSGFFISEDGYVVTNHHVIDKASKITIQTKNGDEYSAKLIGSDKLTDIAVLKVTSSKKFKSVPLNTKPHLRVGEWVIAVGNPFGLGGTATAGIISAVGREIPPTFRTSVPYYDFIQIDAPINRGNSGGPTFDLQGRVIGVNSQIFSPTGGNVGIGFAIPSDVVAGIVDKLIKKGRVDRGWLGVTIGPVDKDIAESLGLKKPEGAIVQSIVGNSPAEKAGFKAGDVLITINGTKISNNSQATRMVGALMAGDTARMEINRNGQKKSLRVKIGERPDEKTLNRLTANGGGVEQMLQNSPELGLSVRSLSETEREEYGLNAPDGGVLIEKVEKDSAAMEKGLRSGMILLQAGRAKISTPEDLLRAVQAAQKEQKKALLLLVQSRPGQRIFVGLPLTEEK